MNDRWQAMVATTLLWLLQLPAVAAQPGAACGSDRTIEVCVISAVLTPQRVQQNGDVDVKVSLSLELSNVTTTPIAVSLSRHAAEWSFAPRNADSITPSQFDVQGVTTCADRYSCKSLQVVDYTVFVPARRHNVQIVLYGRVPAPAAPLLRNSARATLAGVVNIGEKGQHRFVPIPLPEFAFFNGLASAPSR